MVGHDATAANGTWDIASAAIDARAAMQSRCDAKAALPSLQQSGGMLTLQQSGGMLVSQQFTLAYAVCAARGFGCCKTSNCFGVSCCHCIIVSVLFRLFRAMLQSQQYPGAPAGIVRIRLLEYEAERQTLKGPSLKKLPTFHPVLSHSVPVGCKPIVSPL